MAWSDRQEASAHLPQRAWLSDGRLVEVWPREAVEARLMEAASTLRLLPRRDFSTPVLTRWPALMAELRGGPVDEKERAFRLRRRPTAGEISRMHEVLPWFQLVTDPAKRKVLFARMLGVRPNDLARRFDISRETVRRWYLDALEEVVRKINSQ